MNFDGFAEKLRASAEKAAQAAQNFKGFDEMAANDEYIHTEGFNTAPPNRRKNQPHQAQQLHPQDHYLMNNNDPSRLNDDTSTLSTHSSFARVDRQRASAAARHELSHHQSAPPHEVIPSKVTVPEQHQTSKRHHDGLMSDFEDDDSSSDDDGDDPIMSAIRQARLADQSNTAPQLPVHPDRQKNSSKPSTTRNNNNNNKKAHRFMQDMDAHVAAPQQELPPASFSAQSSLPPTTTTGSTWLLSALRGKAGAFGNAKGNNNNNNNTATPATVAPLARKKYESTNNNNDDDLEAVVVVSSAGMLGDEERQQLAELRKMQHASPNLCSWGLSIVAQHPREAFIGFTLLLGSFAYFHSKVRSLDE